MKEKRYLMIIELSDGRIKRYRPFCSSWTEFVVLAQHFSKCFGLHEIYLYSPKKLDYVFKGLILDGYFVGSSEIQGYPASFFKYSSALF